MVIVLREGFFFGRRTVDQIAEGGEKEMEGEGVYVGRV